MKRRSFFIITFLLLYTLSIHAQFVSFGQDPSSFRWRQIQTSDFQLIYPDFYEQNAQRMANIFTRLYQHAKLGKKNVQPISIILHCGGGISNGNVALAPRKAELYTIPEQEPSDDWLEHLCTHEFRHVAQIDRVNRGMTKTIYYIFGDIFPTAVIGLYVPMWFMEGDAVAFESSILNLGRGRSPEFLNQMKAQVVEKGIYPMQKAILGSNKDYIPNRYTFGYYMVANTRANYGVAIWKDALARCGQHPFGITPFSTSLKLSMRHKRDSIWNSAYFRTLFNDPVQERQINTYKSSLRTLYHDNFSQLRAEWINEIQNNTYSHFDTIKTGDRFFANYHYPKSIGADQVLTYKQGINESGCFVLLDDGREIPITKTATLYDYQYAYRDSLIVWCEYVPHIRWEHAGHNTLTSFNMRTGTYQHHPLQLNSYAPFVFANGWGFVTVDHLNRASIMYMGADFTDTLTLYRARPNEQLLHPSASDRIISCVAKSPDGLQLIEINVNNGERKELTPILNYEIDYPTKLGSTTFYRSATSGNNAIHIKRGLDPVNRVISTPFGCNYPTLSSDSSLLFSFYTSDGYKPGRIPLSQISYTRPQYNPFTLAQKMTQQEKWELTFGNDTIFTTKPYRKLSNLFNIHSWGPAVIDPQNQEADLGLVLYSQNLLSTMFVSAGYALQSGFEYGQWFIKTSYQGFFPILDFEVESGRYKYDYFDKTAQLVNNTETDTLYLHNKAWLSSAKLSVRIPFNLSRRNYSRFLQPFITYKIEGIHNTKTRSAYRYNTNQGYFEQIDPNNYNIRKPRTFYQLLEYGFQVSNRMRQTQRELWPRFSQTFQLGYGHTPLNYLDYGAQWWTQLNTFFPGLLSTHSFYLYTGYQDMTNKARNYDNKIISPRGIDLYGYRMFSLRTTYQMPLAFTDWSIGSSWYIKNVSGGVFFDYGFEKQVLRNRYFNSFGIELKTDSYLLRLPFAITAGIRTGYETKTHSMFVNLLFNIGIDL